MKKPYRSDKCLNCDHPLDVSDRFCSNCGQRNSIKRLTLGHFFDEFLSNFYAYDSKLRRSVASMFLKPGGVARAFCEGKRNTYANPFRLYLSVSLVFFIITGIISKWDNNTLIKETQTFQVERDSIFNANAPVQFRLEDSLKTPETKMYTEAEVLKYPFFKRILLKTQTFVQYIDKNPNKNALEALKDLDYQPTSWNIYLFKKSKDSQSLFDGEGQGTTNFINYLQAKMPFILFLSLPLLTFCFKLVYIRHDITYAEHMVFVFSFMTFVFLMFLINTLTEFFFDFNIGSILSAGIAFYFYKSLRFFYQEQRWKTLIKFVILNGLLIISTAILFIIVFGVVFLLY